MSSLLALCGLSARSIQVGGSIHVQKANVEINQHIDGFESAYESTERLTTPVGSGPGRLNERVTRVRGTQPLLATTIIHRNPCFRVGMTSHCIAYPSEGDMRERHIDRKHADDVGLTQS